MINKYKEVFNMDRVKLNELKEGLMRCIITYKDNDGKGIQSEVYSIGGE